MYCSILILLSVFREIIRAIKYRIKYGKIGDIYGYQKDEEELLFRICSNNISQTNVRIGFVGDIKRNVSKPVIAYIAGKNAPEGKRMGHAGAIISGDVGTAKGKIEALKVAGASIANLPWDVPKILKELL